MSAQGLVWLHDTAEGNSLIGSGPEKRGSPPWRGMIGFRGKQIGAKLDGKRASCNLGRQLLIIVNVYLNA